jgi:cell division protein ZipA
MDLRTALLLLGGILIGIVALTTFDRARFRRRMLTRRRGSEASQLPSVASVTTHSGLDINPAPPLAGDRVLDTAAEVTLPERNAESEFTEAIDEAEQMASIPIDLSLSLADPVVGADPRRHPPLTMPDEKIDFVVQLPGKTPVLRDKVLGIFRQNEYLLEKPRYLYGLNRRTGLWSNLDSAPEAAEFSHIAVAIQLVDSRGPIDESELNTFMQMGLKMADALGRPTKLGVTFEQALEKARLLDEFCEANDVIASVNLIANGPTGFHGDVMDAALRGLGLQYGPMNIYHRKNSNPLGCRHLFSVANLYQPGELPQNHLVAFRTEGLTVFMNVPCAYRPVHVFDEMIATSRELALRLDGRLCDQNRRALTDQGIQVIRAQIERIGIDMQNHGIPPGGPTAMRLF